MLNKQYQNNAGKQPEERDQNLLGPPIASYSRTQALENGVLVDVSALACEAGFRIPVAITEALWGVITTIPKEHAYQDREGRLWDVLTMAMIAMRNTSDQSRVIYQLILYRDGSREKFCELVADCGPGDRWEPVITIGFPPDF